MESLPFIVSGADAAAGAFHQLPGLSSGLSLIVCTLTAYINPETSQPITLFQVQNILNSIILRIVRRYAPQYDFAFLPALCM